MVTPDSSVRQAFATAWSISSASVSGGASAAPCTLPLLSKCDPRWTCVSIQPGISVSSDRS